MENVLEFVVLIPAVAGSMCFWYVPLSVVKYSVVSFTISMVDVGLLDLVLMLNVEPQITENNPEEDLPESKKCQATK